MTITYSIHEASSRFSDITKMARDGYTVTISDEGEPVAEIRPIGYKKKTTEERLDELERRGQLVRTSGPRRPFKPVAHVPGAFERFLANHNE